MKQYKCVSTHPEDLDDGRVVAPGERTDLSDEQAKLPVAARLFAEGKLIAVSEEGEKVALNAANKHTRNGGDN